MAYMFSAFFGVNGMFHSKNNLIDYSEFAFRFRFNSLVKSILKKTQQ